MDCRNCGREIGAEVKVQPTNVDGEQFCPRCFVGVRMNMEPERFNASQTAAVRCQFCKFESVTQGARPGSGLRCGNCHRFGCLRVPLGEMPVGKLTIEAVNDGLSDAMKQHGGSARRG